MLYLSKNKGVSGNIKTFPESFIVKEISKNGTLLERDIEYSAEQLGQKAEENGKFCNFIIQKRDWTTIQALMAVAKKVGRGKRSVGYAGMKDKRAVTTQLASIYGTSAEWVKSVHVKDINITSAWNSNEGIKLGDLMGNAFEITIENVKDPESAEKTVQELNGFVPNYFDRQRFGSRLNNHMIGLHILRGEYEEAVMNYLTYTGNERNEGAIEARKKLLEERNFKDALEYFPPYLKYERSVIDYIARYDNFANSFRKLPKGILLMFMHSVEDYIFNTELEARIKDNSINENCLFAERNFYGFPDMEKVSVEKNANGIPTSSLVGYETKAEHINQYQIDAMDDVRLSQQDFKIKSMPDLSLRGSYRTLLAPFKDFSMEQEGSSLKLKFSLPAGTYATIFTGEITKTEGLELLKVK